MAGRGKSLPANECTLAKFKGGSVSQQWDINGTAAFSFMYALIDFLGLDCVSWHAVSLRHTETRLKRGHTVFAKARGGDIQEIVVRHKLR